MDITTFQDKQRDTKQETDNMKKSIFICVQLFNAPFKTKFGKFYTAQHTEVHCGIAALHINLKLCKD